MDLLSEPLVFMDSVPEVPSEAVPDVLSGNGADVVGVVAVAEPDVPEVDEEASLVAGVPVLVDEPMGEPASVFVVVAVDASVCAPPVLLVLRWVLQLTSATASGNTSIIFFITVIFLYREP